MRLNRAQSIYVAIGILVLVFAIGLIFLRSNQRAIVAARPKPEPTAKAFPTSLPQGKSEADPSDEKSDTPSLFTMNEFHRSETKDGRTVWEINGSRGEYFPQTNTAKIQNAKLIMYDKQGKTSELVTKEAEVYLDGPTLGRAHGHLGVTIIHHGETTLTTDEADYDRAKGTVKTLGPVKITGPKADITANKLDGDVNTQTFTFSGDVVTIIKPKARG